MKVRSGFVSNSSSSSFIIGIGKIVDVDKFKDKIEEIGCDKYDITIKQVKDLESLNDRWYAPFKDGVLTEESFMDSTVSLNTTDMTPDDYVFLYSFCGHDDCDFWDEEYGYDNVYKDGFFDDSEESMMSLIEDDDYVIDGKYDFGAGRNG